MMGKLEELDESRRVWAEVFGAFTKTEVDVVVEEEEKSEQWKK